MPLEAIVPAPYSQFGEYLPQSQPGRFSAGFYQLHGVAEVGQRTF